jgi:hypothetical protein
VIRLGRKRTKREALERLASVPDLPLKGKAGMINKGARLGAAALIMLDPFDLLADQKIVLPLDMVAIPAYQAYMIDGSPSMQIYIRAGETIVPTGGNVRDVQEALDEVPSPSLERLRDTAVRKSKTPSAYQRLYKKEFSRLKPQYVKKDGTWKKDGFKRCVKAAHAAARKN